jgi:hypothetical protein
MPRRKEKKPPFEGTPNCIEKGLTMGLSFLYNNLLSKTEQKKFCFVNKFGYGKELPTPKQA